MVSSIPNSQIGFFLLAMVLDDVYIESVLLLALTWLMNR